MVASVAEQLFTSLNNNRPSVVYACTELKIAPTVVAAIIIAPTDFSSWSELQSDAISANDAFITKILVGDKIHTRIKNVYKKPA